MLIFLSGGAKNGKPTFDLQVEEDSTKQYGKKNTAEFGQTINFRATINVHAGAQNYVLHDKMSAGLTFQGVTKIEHVIPGTSTPATSPAASSVSIAPYDVAPSWHGMKPSSTPLNFA